MALPAEKDRYTFADCLTWGEDEQVEIIDGEPVMMAPPTTAHQLISGEIFRQFANYLQGKSAAPFPSPLQSGSLRKTGTARRTWQWCF